MQDISTDFSSSKRKRVSLAIFFSLVLHVFVMSLWWLAPQPPKIEAVMTTFHLNMISKDAGDRPETNLVPEAVSPAKVGEPTEAPAEITDKPEPESQQREAKATELAEPVEQISQPKNPVPAITETPPEPPSKPEAETNAETLELDQQEDFSEANSDLASPAPSLPGYDIGSQKNPRPKYPGIARKRGWQGTVVIGVSVGVDGRADKVIIVESSNYGVFDYAAYETVLNEWVFDPAEYLGQSVEGYIEVPISFELR